MVPLIRRVSIRNYKSIGQAVVDLEPFTVLVGRNGAGKSNFIDALAFVGQCLSDSIELAFKNRGGIGAVRRRSGGHPTHIGIRVDVQLADHLLAEYAFEIAAKPKERFRVARERCLIREMMGKEHVFEVENGEFSKAIHGIRAKVALDRLALFAASATEEFRPVYDFLTAMRFYSITPDELRELQEPDPGDYLKRDGSNAAAVLKQLREKENGTDQYKRLCRLLSKVAQGVTAVEERPVGQKETLQFKQDVGLKHPWTFDALNMSDGTLRVLGLLLGVYQPGRPSVVAIEEPEATVHPAAAEILTQVLIDASHERPVLVTTHSPDILDHNAIRDDQIRVVTMVRGSTMIVPTAESSREFIRRGLYTAGELLRSDELNPDLDETKRRTDEPSLFSRQWPETEGKN